MLVGSDLPRFLEDAPRTRAIPDPDERERLPEARLHPAGLQVEDTSVRRGRLGELPEPPQGVPRVEVGVDHPGVRLRRAAVVLHGEPVLAARRREHPEVEPPQGGPGVVLHRGLEVGERLVAVPRLHQGRPEVEADRRHLRGDVGGHPVLVERLLVPRLLEETGAPGEVHPPSRRQRTDLVEERVERGWDQVPATAHLDQGALVVPEPAVREAERVPERARLRRDLEGGLETPRGFGVVASLQREPTQSAEGGGRTTVEREGSVEGLARRFPPAEFEERVPERHPGRDRRRIDLRRAAVGGDRIVEATGRGEHPAPQVRPGGVVGEEVLRGLVRGERGSAQGVRVVDLARRSERTAELSDRVGASRRPVEDRLEIGARRGEVIADLRLEVGEIGPREVLARGRSRGGAGRRGETRLAPDRHREQGRAEEPRGDRDRRADAHRPAPSVPAVGSSSRWYRPGSTASNAWTAPEGSVTSTRTGRSPSAPRPKTTRASFAER